MYAKTDKVGIIRDMNYQALLSNDISSLYENKNPTNSFIIKAGYSVLLNFKFIKELFIKQAMGRTNLID